MPKKRMTMHTRRKVLTLHHLFSITLATRMNLLFLVVIQPVNQSGWVFICRLFCIPIMVGGCFCQGNLDGTTMVPKSWRKRDSLMLSTTEKYTTLQIK